MRVSELCNLNVLDVDIDECCVRVFGKGSKERMVFFMPSLIPYLKEYINKINICIKDYLDKQYLKDIGECFVLVERTLANSKKRTGIVLAVDLEDYSYELGSKTNIRASEYTIVDRIPPRLEIRKNSPIELPHILFLYNDPNNVVYNEIINDNPTKELLNHINNDLPIIYYVI